MDATQEHTQTQEAPTVTPGEFASRDELIAAVREAGGTESVDVAAEEQAATQTATGEQQAEGQAAEEPRIDRILKEREKAFLEREAARNHAQELMQQAQQEAQQEANRILQEARERADREWQAELERRRAEFNASPTAHLRALGDPQQIVDTVLKENTPEARALQAMQKEIAETKQTAAEAVKAKNEVDTLRQQLQQEAYQREVSRVRDSFLGEHASREKTPYAYAEHRNPDGVFEAADRKAIEWRKSGLRLGVDFDFNDVAQYIEREAKTSFLERAKALGLNPAPQASAEAPARVPGIAPKAQANGSRTLSAAAGSERRTSPKPLFELTPDQQRAELIAEVEAVRKANPDAKF